MGKTLLLFCPIVLYLLQGFCFIHLLNSPCGLLLYMHTISPHNEQDGMHQYSYLLFLITGSYLACILVKSEMFHGFLNFSRILI